MTWHVTDYLWMGGTADGGYRALDTGGDYLVSNWLLLCVVLLLVASRIPWMSLPSRVIWRSKRAKPKVVAIEVPRVGISAPMALLSRRHSGFCGLNRLDGSAKADHYSRKLMAPLRIYQAELPRDRARKPAWGI